MHKAGEKRRRGATPATVTQPPSSWKARDPMRPSKARPLRVQARRKTTGGPRQSPRSVCLPSARSSKFMFARTSGASEGRGAVRGKTRARQSERSDVRRDRAKESTFTGGARLSPRSGRQARPEGREKVIWNGPHSGRVQAKRGRAWKRDAMGREKPEGRGSHREARVCRRVDLVLCCNGNSQAYAPRDNPASFRRVVRGAQAGHWRGFFAGWIRCH